MAIAGFPEKMKSFLLLILTAISSFLAYVVYDQNRTIQALIGAAAISPVGGEDLPQAAPGIAENPPGEARNFRNEKERPTRETIVRVESSESSAGTSQSTSMQHRHRSAVGTENRLFDQYFDAEKAFAKDQLFAVMAKQTIRAEHYVDRFDKNLLGNPKTKTHPAVYILRCLGRETRENYLFIVDRTFHDRAKIHEKFTKAEMSNFEFFLSEERLERTIFHRRFRSKMID